MMINQYKGTRNQFALAYSDIPVCPAPYLHIFPTSMHELYAKSLFQLKLEFPANVEVCKLHCRSVSEL